MSVIKHKTRDTAKYGEDGPRRIYNTKPKAKTVPLMEYDAEGPTQTAIEQMHAPMDAYLRTPLGSPEALERLDAVSQ